MALVDLEAVNMSRNCLSTFLGRTSGLILLIVATLVGCDSGVPVGKVTGVVTYAGAPLSGAEVEFTPKGDGTSSVGFTNQEGEYELQYTLHRKGALLGSHAVQVRSLSMDDREQAKIRAASQSAKIEYEVEPGSNEFNIDLQAVDPSQLGRNRR